MAQHQDGITRLQPGLQPRPMDLLTAFADDLHDEKSRGTCHLKIRERTIHKTAFGRNIKLFNLNTQLGELSLNVPQTLVLTD